MLVMGKVKELSSVPGDNFARWPEGTPDLEYCIRMYFVRLLGAVFLSHHILNLITVESTGFYLARNKNSAFPR